MGRWGSLTQNSVGAGFVVYFSVVNQDLSALTPPTPQNFPQSRVKSPQSPVPIPCYDN